MIELWNYRANITRVIDGDTVEAYVDHGMCIMSRQSLRLNGINAPELFTGTPEERAAGKVARDTLDAWVTAHRHMAEWPFLIHTLKDRRSFNRYVADIECTQGHKVLA